MKLTKLSQYFVIFSLPLCLNFAQSSFTARAEAQLSNPGKTWQISQTFKPPKRGAPPVSAGGSTRGGSCLARKKFIIPLMPQNKLGLTVSERPTFFWYIPESSVKTAKFLLFADNDETLLYEKSFTLPDKPGIASFTLPKNVPGLTVDKTYHWYMTIVCNSQDSSNNPIVDGWVERIKPGLALSEALAKADLRQLPSIYAEAGIWHEALTSLVQLRQTEPNNLKARLGWREFFKSVGLDAIASSPLI
ncbi:MAG: DUF928 domain-containing protein [Nostoc sp. ChiSLP02]|nr:DUF928 domain-containing protein [Nostoc sp. DedSLP05]MDZ8098823.1 DUF928 domain-containing protein [Nostoc sp. DedSLP01]MDZ8183563.1 DUF928 domain-containing protein [Nostoc sp. ChiSLP02]